MSTAYMRKKVEERAALSDLISTTLDKAAKDNRDPSGNEKAQLDEWAGRCAALDDEIGKLEAQARGNRNFEQIISGMGRDEERAEIRERQRREADEPKVETRSIGEMFVNSEEFTSYAGRGSSRPVEFAGFLESRAAITTADLAIPAHVYTPGTPTFTAPLLNVIGREVVSSGNVEFVTWGEVSPAPVVAEGALKPEATLVPVPGNLPLSTFAHFKPITRQALEDAPRIQSIIESALRQGLARGLSDAAVAVLNAETGFTPVAGADLSSGIRVAIGEVQAAGFNPNAALMDPGDFAALDISTAAGANNGPNGYNSYWGVTPVPVPGIASGTAYVGDFKEALTWFDRNKSGVFISDSHADNFIRNILVILAETRAAFASTNPAAAAKVTFTPPVALNAAAKK